MSQARGRQRETNEGRLYRIFTTHLSEADLRKFCADLDLDYDHLPGNTYEAKARILASIVAQQDLRTPSRASAPQPKRRQLSPERSQIFDNWQRPSSRLYPPPRNTLPLPPEPPIPLPTPNMPFSSFVHRNRRIISCLTFVLIFGFVVGSALQVFKLILLERSNPQAVVEVTRLVEATRIIEVTRLVEVSVNQITSNTGGSTPADIVQDQPTADSSSPTPLPEPTSSTIVFIDDFERGLAPEWQIAYGEMDMSNGNLTVVFPFGGGTRNHMIVLEEYVWSDFTLTTHIAPFNSSSFNPGRGGILVRQLTEDQWAGAFITPENQSIGFATFDQSGNYDIRPGSMVRLSDFDLSINRRGIELRIEASGNTYILYVDGQMVTSTTFAGSTSSRIGLWAQNSNDRPQTDHYAPRFEDIRIESVP